MDDSILTILFYVGIIILASFGKSISKFMKNNNEKVDNQENNEVGFLPEAYLNNDFKQNIHGAESVLFSDYNSHIEVIKEDNISVSTSENNLNKNTSVVSYHFDHETMEDDNAYLPYFIDFDIKSAIIYSEILKRPEY